MSYGLNYDDLPNESMEFFLGGVCDMSGIVAVASK